MFSTSWFKENEDLGDIIKSHRNLVSQVASLTKELETLKSEMKVLKEGGKR